MATRRKIIITAAARKQGVPKKKLTARVRKNVTLPTASIAKTNKPSDYEGARQLLSRYCALIDQGNLIGLSELFHPKAKFSVSFDSVPSHTGRAAIFAWYKGFFRGWPKVTYPRHKIFEPYLIVDGNRATASTYFDSDFVEPNGNVTVLAGRYDDVLTRERGQWCFMERTITIFYHFSPGQSGEGMKR